MKGNSAFFPKLTAANKTGKIGVDAVTSLVSNELGWLFRQNHQENDYGIDGYIDVVLEDGSVTGQSIAVQIKTGKSFFEAKTSAGYVFSGDMKHLNYYLNHDIPIIIIICMPETSKCYWEVFAPEKTERTKSNWKLVIPFGNQFNNSSKKALLALVGPPKDYSSALETHWAFTEALHASDRVHFMVSRSEILALEVQPLLNFFERITVNPTTCIKLQGRVIFSVSGYNSDLRELWEIPEVRKWIAFAEPLVPSWFFFLAPEQGVLNSLKLLLTCLCPVKRITVEEGIQKLEIEYSDAFEPFMMKNFCGLNELTERLGIDDQNERISRDVMKALELPTG